MKFEGMCTRPKSLRKLGYKYIHIYMKYTCSHIYEIYMKFFKSKFKKLKFISLQISFFVTAIQQKSEALCVLWSIFI